VTKLLDDAGVWAIVVGHGDGLGGASLHFGFPPHTDEELIGAAAEVAKNAKVSALLVPGLGTIARSRARRQRRRDDGAHRQPLHRGPTPAFSISGLARQLGLEAHTMLAMIHTATPERIAENGQVAAAAGSQAVGLVDSAGTLMPDEGPSARGSPCERQLPDDVAVSFHAHNKPLPRCFRTRLRRSRKARR